MNNDSNDSFRAQDLANSGPRPRASQRLDGPDALLTAEWKIEDLSWIHSDGLVPLGDDTARLASSQCRERGATEPAAVAPPGVVGSFHPGITVPKKVRSQFAPPPTVVVAPDLGATLPPMAERQQLQSEVPSVERDAEPSLEGGWLARLQRRHWPLATLGILLCATTAYAVSSSLVHSDEESAALEATLPEFLRDPAATRALPSAVEPLPATGALPSEVALALAHAADEAAAGVAPDAGAPAAPTDVLAQSAEASAPPDPAEPSHHGGTSPSSLEAEGAEREAPQPSSKGRKTPPPLSVAPSASDRVAAIAAKPASEALSPSKKARRRDAGARVSAPETRLQAQEASRAIRPLTTYTYGNKALFSVATAPMRVTDLVLEPGEKLMSRPTAGDAARWVISVLDSITRGEPQSHVFVKPLRPGLRTNLTLTTNRRSYFLELSSSEDGKYMAGVQWQYPLDAAERRRQELARAERERQSTTAVSNLEALSFDYRIQVTAGAPSWKPTMVFDDGEKTFIRFPGAVSPAPAPLLFVLRSGNAKDAKFVNYRVKNDLYVLDRVIDSAELRLESAETSQDVVRITRR